MSFSSCFFFLLCFAHCLFISLLTLVVKFKEWVAFVVLMQAISSSFILDTSSLLAYNNNLSWVLHRTNVLRTTSWTYDSFFFKLFVSHCFISVFYIFDTFNIVFHCCTTQTCPTRMFWGMRRSSPSRSQTTNFPYVSWWHSTWESMLGWRSLWRSNLYITNLFIKRDKYYW